MSSLTRLSGRIDGAIGRIQALNGELNNLQRGIATIGTTGGAGASGATIGSGGGGGGGTGLVRVGGSRDERLLPELRNIALIMATGFQMLGQLQAAAARSNDATTRASR